MNRTVALVGARGHVGKELIALLSRHPDLDIAWVSSRQLAGQAVPDAPTVHYEALDADAVADRGADVCVLALPNNLSSGFVAALNTARPDTVIVDLSGDHRFDDAWHYGLPELNRGGTGGRTRIANPGCYATAMQLAIAPARTDLDAAPMCFGVSGYSGAGTKPSPKNDPAVLTDNLLPYALSGHLHEREVSRQLGRPVCFVPHVAGFFRGISMTVVMQTKSSHDAAYWHNRYREFYCNEALVGVTTSVPEVRHARNRHSATIGGFTTGPDNRLVVVATLDNLLKGAATQALQNINLACGFDEFEGIPHG